VLARARNETVQFFSGPVRDRAAAFAGLAPEALPHVLATEYTPGAPIGWHRGKAVFGALQAIQP
jgi:alkylated DNA repair dioxygenase AlkB